jgi:hypothetical protein
MDYEALSQSAERRLLEHRRRELGAQPSSFTNATWSRTREAPTTLAPATTIDRTGARLDVSVTAWPAEGLIPGAVVTVTVVVNNGGIENADGVAIFAPIPTGAAYRPGSLKHDGRDADDISEVLFGEGFKLGKVIAAGRSALTWKLDVLAGTTDLILSPTVQADVPVISARPLVLRRGKMTGAFRTDLESASAALDVPTTHEDVEAPFYELTEEEEIVETAVLSAISTTTVAPVIEEPPAPPRQMLYRTLRPGDMSFVERLLEAPLGLLPHFVFSNLLAVATAGDGSDPLGLAAFVDREAALLGRLKVAARLGKPLQLEDNASSAPALDIEHAAVRFVNPPSHSIPGAVLLGAPVDAQRITDARNAYDRPVARWLALRLVTLAFCAQGLADDTNPASAAIKTALTSYTTQARLAFVAFGTRMKLDRRLDPTKAATTQLDAAAKAVIAALRAAITQSE